MSLAPEWRVNGLVLTDYPFSVPFDGVDYGAPDVTADVLLSLLGYGDVEVTSHIGNRTLSLPILIEGADLAETAAGEKALWAAVSAARGEVYCDPGDGFAEPMVWDVFPGQMTLARAEAFEAANLRSYTLTFRALPYSRSSVLTQVTALSTGVAGPTTVDNGSATTNWTASGTLAVVSGAVQTSVTTTGVLPSVKHRLTRTAAIDVSVTKYLRVDWAVTGGDPMADGLHVYADAVALTPLATQPAAPGFVGTVFEVPAAVTSIAALTATVMTSALTAGVQAFRIDQIVRTDAAPLVGTTRQMSRSWTVGGSAPTEGQIAVEHPSSSLGKVLVYTRPDPGTGYIPALRPYLTSTAGTTDSSTVSGARNALTSTQTFKIPFAALPRGTYQVWARVRSTTADAQTFSVSLTHGIGGVSFDFVQTFQSQVAYEGGSVWQIACLADGLPIPAADMLLSAQSDIVLNITQTTSTGTPTTALDEVWLFEVEQGDLTVVDCGTDAPTPTKAGNRLWITPPSVQRPRWGVFIGTAADQSDAHYPGDSAILAYPSHRFALGNNLLFTVTDHATSAAASLTYYPRWIFHAGS